MARGNEAKEKFIDKMIAQNSDSYVGHFDKKYYFWEEENGEKVQVAISITCPKNLVGGAFSTAPAEKSSETTSCSTEITKEERQTVEELMKELNLL